MARGCRAAGASSVSSLPCGYISLPAQPPGSGLWAPSVPDKVAQQVLGTLSGSSL